MHLAPTSSHEVQYDNRGNSDVILHDSYFRNISVSGNLDVYFCAEGRKDREKLFNEDSSDMKPRLRTREEILATYRKAGVISSIGLWTGILNWFLIGHLIWFFIAGCFISG